MKAPGAEADVLIVGQGIAGTLLAWECERAGIPFRLAAGAEGAPAMVSRVVTKSRTLVGMFAKTARRMVPVSPTA
jgi:glycine/D-amino acid oxidase-like deaminating enzyme